MTQFVRAANPIWWLPDLTGQPLNDSYWAFFLQNVFPYNFQPVYVDPLGNTPWPDPLQFMPNGTLPDNMYFDDTLTYRIEVRQGPTSADPLIYEIDNFVPGSNISPGNTALVTATNMITNPQFADIYFTTPPGSSFPTFTYVESDAGNYSVYIGPGWRIDLQGAGSLTVTQKAPEGSSAFPGDPNYFIEITSSGWTSVNLVQRFKNNGAIFGGGAIAVAFTAEAQVTSTNVTVQYAPSVSTDSPANTNIFNGLVTVGSFIEYKGAVNLPVSTNSNTDGSAYVDIIFVLPVGSDLSFTNIQITGQSNTLPAPFVPATSAPGYAQQTYERTVDQEFNVYKPWLFNKRIPSLLTGWDFPLNPAQFTPMGTTYRGFPVQAGANTSYYAWDQTILFQSATNAITVSSPPSGDLTLTAAVTTQMAIIQYLEGAQAVKALSDALAVNISATSTTASNAGIPCTVSMWYTTGDLPNLAPTGGTPPNSASLIATLDANGKPATFHTDNGTWIEVPKLNQQDPIFTIGSASSAAPSEYNDYNFMGWDLQGIAAVNTATYFAIVIGTASITSGDALHINSVGMMNGHIATRPAPQTLDQVLQECQFYYERSYDVTIPSGTQSIQDSFYATVPLTNVGGNDVFSIKSFYLQFKRVKRVTTYVLTGFNPYFTNAISVYIAIHTVGGGQTTPSGGFPSLGSWSISQEKGYALGYASNNDGTFIFYVTHNNLNEGQMFFHYVADARLGIV